MAKPVMEGWLIVLNTRSQQLKPVRRTGTLISGLRFTLAMFWREHRLVLILCALDTVLRVALPFLRILLPKVVIDQIEAHAAPHLFVLKTGGLALILVAVNYCRGFTGVVVDRAVGILGISSTLSLQLRKLMRMDYERMEDPEFIKVQEKADKAAYSNNSPAVVIPRMLVETLANLAGFLLYAGIILAAQPLILPILLAAAAVNWLMLSRARRYMEATRDERGKLEKKVAALHETLRSPEAAKDIRSYAAADWLSGLCRRYFDQYRKAERGVITRQTHAQLVDALMILLRDGAAYAFLISLVLNGTMSLGDFVYVFAAVGAISGWMSGFLAAAGDLRKACVEVGDVRAELDYPDRMNTGDGVPPPRADAPPPSIELRNVSYTYPKAERATLSGINVTIRSGERIALVGANGAGKTTMVKLICGLYAPTQGEVLLNGHSSLDYSRDEFYKLFSVVFQDIHMLPASITENVSQQPLEGTDRAKTRACLERVGLAAKINSLPRGADTMLVRAVHADAIELSGGEAQKVAMARALYKDAPVILLDEPTAALDPLAEDEVYRQYAALTDGKTSVYISHRLASTRFCDRILLLDGNRIAEEGTHDELLALGGIYASMFNMQASYYRPGQETGEEAAL